MDFLILNSFWIALAGFTVALVSAFLFMRSAFNGAVLSLFWMLTMWLGSVIGGLGALICLFRIVKRTMEL